MSLNPNPIFSDSRKPFSANRVNVLLDQVMNERIRQNIKFGGVGLHTPLAWLTILGEEVGEVTRAVVENDRANYREELIQVAATAIAAVEALDLTEDR